MHSLRLANYIPLEIVALAFNVSDYVQSSHTGPALLWHVFTLGAQNRGQPNFFCIELKFALMLHFRSKDNSAGPLCQGHLMWAKP
jgi:hypothetical protein